MQEFLTENYLLIKALHIISVICWMAGMFYLPRLYVYHTRAKVGSELDLTLRIMEKKLLRFIINPSMIASFFFGLVLVYIIGPGIGKWFHVKLLLVLVMTAVHGVMAKFRKGFEKGINLKSERFYRIFNELPPLLMIFIVLLAVMQPF